MEKFGRDTQGETGWGNLRYYKTATSGKRKVLDLFTVFEIFHLKNRTGGRGPLGQTERLQSIWNEGAKRKDKKPIRRTKDRQTLPSINGLVRLSKNLQVRR